MDANAVKEDRLKDQFTPETRAVRRNLLVASSIAILLSLPGVEISGFLGVSVQPWAADIARGAVAAIVAYELAAFVLYASVDRKSWLITPRARVSSALFERLDGVQSSLSGLKRTIDEQTRLIKSGHKRRRQLRHALKIVPQAAGALEPMVEDMRRSHADLIQQIRIHDRIHAARTYGVDWGLPLLLGGFALFRSWAALWAVGAALIAPSALPAARQSIRVTCSVETVAPATNCVVAPEKKCSNCTTSPAAR